jgi:hypothetical protein
MIYLSGYQDVGSSHQELDAFLDDVHNRKRVHLSLSYLTPRAFGPQWLKR